MSHEAKAEDTHPEALQRAEAALKELYAVHDEYFPPDKRNKQQILQQKIAEVEAALAPLSTEEAATHKARVAFVRGKALDASEKYSKEAEEQLAKAVKLEPSNYEAWNALGNCFWKKGAVRDAYLCFKHALEQNENTDSLCRLSMLLRSMGETQRERAASIQESVSVAKRAVALDVRDGRYVLGNAFLTRFFAGLHDPEDLASALKAYTRAESGGEGEKNPDLHYNRANVRKYLQDYELAISGYRRAQELDPGLPAAQAAEDVQRFMHRVASLVARKGHVKPKRLRALVADMPREAHFEGRQRIAVADLGSEGPQVGKFVVLRTLLPVGMAEDPPACFVSVDASEACCIVALYNLGEGRRAALDRAGATLTVLDPIVKRISVPSEDGAAGAGPTTTLCLQIFDPRLLLVDGKTVAGGIAHAGLSVAHLSS